MPLDDLTILVLHYCTPDLLKVCLERLAAYAQGARVIVLDSSPESSPKATTLPETGSMTGLMTGPRTGPETLVVRVPNHSFAHTLNCGLKLARTPFIAHMNADVFVSAETFPALLGAVKRPQVGMVGPRARTEHGTFQDQGLPYRVYYARSQRRARVAVPWLSGCLQLVRTEAVAKVGGMDASLRFYNEDLEWCHRFRRAGWRCDLVQTDVLHLGGSSTPKDPRFLIEGYRGGYKVSQRYHGTIYQGLHRRVVGLLNAWDERFAKDAVRRDAARQIGAMFRAGAFDESPFGPTLSVSNPAFGAKPEDIPPLAGGAGA